MPLVEGAPAAALGPQGRAPDLPPEQPGPGFLDVAAAAERSSNLAGTLYSTLSDLSSKPEAKQQPGYDPVQAIPKGYEQYGDRFLDAQSPEEVQWIKSRIDSELVDRGVLARAGKGGFAASLAAGMTDPLTLASMAIPGGGETRLLQAARLAVTNAGVSAAQEMAMHELTVTRTASESTFNVAGSAVLGGILGAAIRPHVPAPVAREVGENLSRELHTNGGGDASLGPAQRSVLDTALPSDVAGEHRVAPPQTPPLEERFRSELATDYEGAKARYAALKEPGVADTDGGRILNVDMARELAPDYVADRTRSAEVHEPASDFVKKMYAEKLAEAPQAGKDPMVLFTAGGTGAGKTTAIEAVPGVKAVADRAQIVYDTNMNKLGSASEKVEQALAAGKDVHIAYVYRDPEEALVHGALPRAMRMGRTVPIEEHVKTHAGAFDVIKALQKRYAGNDRVSFSVIDNSRGKGDVALSSMEKIGQKRYNVPVEELRNAVEKEHQAGRISDAVRSGTLGRAAEAGGRVPPNDRAVPGGQPQRESQAAGGPPERGTPAGSEPLEPTSDTGVVNPNEESTAGAAEVRRGGREELARGARTLAGGLIGKVSPSLRVLAGQSTVARRLVQQLANIPEFFEKNFRGEATAQPIERKLWGYEGVWWQGLKARAEQYKAYRERLTADGQTPIARSDFNREIAYAMRRGDQHQVPEVAKAAAQTRATVFQPLYDRAIKAGLVPAEAKLHADSYLTRQYDAVKIRQNMAQWLDTLAAGFRAKGVDPAEARDIAHQATRSVLGSERGTMDWHVMDDIVPRSGQMKERTLTLPDELLEPFLNSDIDHLSHSYLRSMAPEVEFTERFGTRDMKDQFDEVKDDYTRIMERARVAGQDIAPISKEMDKVVADLAAIRDRLYGVYGQPKDPGSFFVRAARVLRSDNALRLLGAATLAHFPDVANVMMRYGMPKTFGAIGKLLTSPGAMRLAGDEAKRMGAALDMVTNATVASLGDFGSHSQFAEQRALAKVTRAFTIITGETPLITMVQGLTSTLAQDEILRAAEMTARGAELGTGTSAKLAAAGLDGDMLKRIAAEGIGHTREVNGLRFGMSDAWTDKGAAQAFESAVLRDAHGVTLRPGAGDTPLFMSTELGKTILQFKSFAFAANRIVVNPLLQGLAHGDIKAIQGLFALTFMGAASYAAKQKAAGQPMELNNPKRLAMEVLDKSNLMGWTSELIFPALWALGMKDLSRWSDRDAAETLLGPSAGTVSSLYERRMLSRRMPGDDEEEGRKDFSRSDLHFLRRLLPGQNLWYFRRAVNALEDSVGDAFDLPGTSQKERAEQVAANQ